MTCVKHSDEVNAQIIVGLLKAHGINQVIASPGNTNMAVLASMQFDPFFTVYSCVDERSAAYMACGLAATSKQPVALTCTGATASRNYLPGLTEAYYRKLPVVAITSFNGAQNIGQLLAQNLDRTQIQRDVALTSVDIPEVKDMKDAHYVNRLVNTALLELTHHGGGPVHINVSTSYVTTFSRGAVPPQRVIKRVSREADFPELNSHKKIAIFIGAHVAFSDEEVRAIESFAESHNVAILVDHTSNYSGKFSLLSTLVTNNISKWQSDYAQLSPELIIHLGEVSGDYPTTSFLEAAAVPVWRVSEDGEVRDRFDTLELVFECGPRTFFENYSSGPLEKHPYYDSLKSKDTFIRTHVPDLPFSNRFIAQSTAPLLPQDSIVHFAILNSLRSWNYFDYDSSIRSYSNTGGFGIDGAISTLIGSSLAKPDVLHFGMIGDLAFFYDMNSIGNRNLGKNIRLLLVNNGTGVEFHMGYSPASVLKRDVDKFVAAAGHFVSHICDSSAAQSWATAMGFTYLSAHDKKEFEDNVKKFVDPAAFDAPVLFECFTNPDAEAKAAEKLTMLDPQTARRERLKNTVKKIVPKTMLQKVKQILKR